MTDEFRRLPDRELDEAREGWERVTDEFDIRFVGAYASSDEEDWDWKVEVAVAEFLREEPMEGELRRQMNAALRAVPGVTEVAEEDREVWGIDGNPSGEELVRAAARVVDALADRARSHIDGLG